MKIRVLCVDDSKPVLDILERLLNSEEDIEVVGRARNGEEALVMVKKLSPDVVTLDIRMPGISGIDVLRNLKGGSAPPVIVVSSYTQPGMKMTIEALDEGAFDFIAKPASGKLSDLIKMKDDLVSLVRAAYVYSRGRAERGEDESGAVKHKITSAEAYEEVVKKERNNLGVLSEDEVSCIEAIGIGSSTGGPFALTSFLPLFPGDFPWPVFVVQHMPPSFTSYFAERLNIKCAVEVKVAQDRETALPGHVYIAPGDTHLVVERSDDALVMRLRSIPNSHYECMPSANALFESLARTIGERAVGILLSGMGRDGAKGLLMMKEAGAITAVQDQSSAIAYGMPGAALKIGAADRMIDPRDIPKFIYSTVRLRALSGTRKG